LNPVLITSFEEYRRIFGFHLPKSYLAYCIDGFFRNGGRRCYIARAYKKDWTFAQNELPCGQGNTMTMKTVGPGNWGNNVYFEIEDSTMYPEKDPERNFYFKLNVYYFYKTPEDPLKDKNDRYKCDIESYDNLCIRPSSDRHYKNAIAGVSKYIRIFDNFEGKDESTLERPGGNDITPITKLAVEDAIGVYNGEKDETDFDGQDDLLLDNGKFIKTGFIGIQDIEDVSIVSVPDATSKTLASKVIEKCEQKKNRFAVISTQESPASIGDLEPIKDSNYAAQYYPWVYVNDPLTGSKKLIPPVGHICGIYARVDILRGVDKAPANETIDGILSLEKDIDSEKQGILNPKGINVIRSFPGRGYLVWGARTISRKPMWKYINVRRLFIFIEKSVERSTQWAVFEPNNERLWSRVKTSLVQFLTTVWKTGALMGTTPEEAFFVRVDRTTMTQNNIDNGMLIVVIGIAPVKPAEFVIFKFAQTQAGVSITEI